jgi:hypothetical protein
MNNPPAFPLHNHGAQTLGLHVTGMTLRDYFAAQVMQALLSDSSWREDMNFYETASAAYAMADRMLKTREL